MKERKILLIRWHDATSYGEEWQSNGKFKPVDTLTVGFLMKETKKRITVCQSYADNKQINQVLTIPRGCILSIVELKYEVL